MSLPLPDRSETVIITGASAGIGRELTRVLAARGYGLTVIARRGERLEALADELRAAHGVQVRPYTCDLGDRVARRELIDELLADERAAVGLCNNAGIGSYGPFASLPFDRERQQIELNVLALHELTGAFVGPMLARGSGAILNVASLAGFQPLPNMATYCGTKAFVVNFSEALSAELSGSGVSCTALCPGPVPTEFAEAAGSSLADSSMPSLVRVSAGYVARRGVEGMLKGKRTVIPGVPSRVLGTAGRVVPRGLLLSLASRFGRRSVTE